jgi:hypothetical protein
LSSFLIDFNLSYRRTFLGFGPLVGNRRLPCFPHQVHQFVFDSGSTLDDFSRIIVPYNKERFSGQECSALVLASLGKVIDTRKYLYTKAIAKGDIGSIW